MHPFLFIILFPLVLFAAQILGTALHELAHALAGRLAGIAIREIRIGRAPWLFSLRFVETTLKVGKIIDSGCVIPYWHPSSSRVRTIIFTAAGPATDLVLLAVAVWLVVAEKVPPALLWIPALVAIVQTRLLYRNLVPHAGVTNDIRIILDTLRSTDGDGGAFRTFYRNSLAAYWDGKGTPPDLSRQSPFIGTLLYQPAENGESLLGDERLKALERHLRRPLQKAEALLILERLATSVLLDWRLDLAPQLDRWTRQALELAPDIATIRGTRGAALCLLGRYREAETLLKQADYSNELNRFYNHLFLAWASHGHGDQTQARAHFSEALSQRPLRENRENDEFDRLAEQVAIKIGIKPPPMPPSCDDSANVPAPPDRAQR